VVTAEGTGNGADGRVQIQQAGQATRQFSSERDRPKAVAYSPDRNTLLIGAELRTEQERGTTAGTTNYSAALLDRSFNTVRRLGGNRQMPTAAAFSNDGRQILIGSGLTNLPGTSEVKLWNVDGIQLLSMPAADEVNAVSFSPDGRHFATAEKDILRLWPTVRDIHERLRVLDIDGLPEADKATVDAWRTRLSLTEVTAAPRTCTAGTTQ
jgi:WD40 repeat protein